MEIERVNFESSFSQKAKIVRRIFKTSVAFNIILLLVTTFCLLYQRYVAEKSVIIGERERKDTRTETKSEMKGKSDSICMSCDHLGDDVRENDTLYDVISYTECHRRICCLRDKSEITTTMSSLVGRHSFKDDLGMTKNLPLTWWNRQSNAAHLFLDHVNTTSLLLWRHVDSFPLSFNNIKLVDNTFQVLQNGLYFAYLVLTFDFSNLDYIPQIYYNLSTKYDDLVMESYLVQGKYGGSTRSHAHHTGFLAGIFRLFKRHRIIPFVNNVNYLDKRPHTSYFGVFKL